MAERRKVMVVTAGRADYTRVRSVMEAIKADSRLELVVVVTGSHLLQQYGRTVTLITADGFRIDESLYSIVDGQNLLTMTQSVGLGVVQLAQTIERLRPHIVIAATDRTESLVTAVTAAMMNCFVAHLQGGEVTGALDESLRHACTKLAHFHFVATADAANRVIRLGERPESVFNVGCPSIDLLKRTAVAERGEVFGALRASIATLGNLGPDEQYLLVLQHPVTTEFGGTAQQMRATLDAVHRVGLPAVLFWPNVDAGAAEMVCAAQECLAEEGHAIDTCRNVPYPLFVALMFHAACMVGNSSAAIRETPYLGTPVVNVGSRQSGRVRGANVVDAPYDAGLILAAIQTQLRHGRFPVEEIYGDGQSGPRIANLLAQVNLSGLQKRITF